MSEPPDAGASKHSDPAAGRRPPERQSSAEAASTYLSRVLQMNPLYQADGVIAARARLLGVVADPSEKPTAGRQTKDRSRQRRKALERLEAIRDVCWTAPPETLAAKLETLDTEGLPDIKAAANRLAVIGSGREKLLAARGDKHFDEDFFSCMQKVLAASPRETAVLREQVLASFRSGKLNRRGRKMIKLTKRVAPELYRLESDWFDALLRQKRVLTVSGQARRVDGYTPPIVEDDRAGIPFWVWWLLLVAGLQLSRAFFTGGGD
ncbi:MAG: hypothetical protein AAF790_02920 [Planctomycetota bacterium]